MWFSGRQLTFGRSEINTTKNALSLRFNKLSNYKVNESTTLFDCRSRIIWDLRC